MSDIQSHAESGVYKQQGFGTPLPVKGNIGLLIVDFVVGFADPKTFGGGNIAPAIERTVHLLAAARRHGWPVAHSRIVYAADGSDDNVFSLKVPGMATLTEDHPNSAIVPELTPARRRTGRAQDRAVRVLRHATRAVVIAARGADVDRGRCGDERMRARKRGRCDVAWFPSAGYVRLRRRSGDRSARCKSLRHAAEICRGDDARRSACEYRKTPGLSTRSSAFNHSALRASVLRVQPAGCFITSTQ